ncbi:hypothetical protein Syun_001930 [Stephania yunnanensis]|uniref:Ataxin-2 C-terminal domain-containing protein n=1 Tax=Stephania yunnanensis TaxID=152371 RepID=A0AAP0LFN5_9MAGN
MDKSERRDMRDLEELLSKLNPMAEEFVPPSLVSHGSQAGFFANNFTMLSNGNGIANGNTCATSLGEVATWTKRDLGSRFAPHRPHRRTAAAGFTPPPPPRLRSAPAATSCRSAHLAANRASQLRRSRVSIDLPALGGRDPRRRRERSGGWRPAGAERRPGGSRSGDQAGAARRRSGSGGEAHKGAGSGSPAAVRSNGGGVEAQPAAARVGEETVGGGGRDGGVGRDWGGT